MGIKRTDEWLEKDFYHPERLCRKMVLSDEEDPRGFYRYLIRFGMYRPSRMAQETYKELVKNEVWHKVQNIYEHYRDIWNGPDIPVYIFPKSRLINETDPDKSGVSFKDKMLLFLNDIKHKKELEALIVHEYHHVCRMNRINKPVQEYTLLDSMVIEGLAEWAVTKYCGVNYNAKWTSSYSEEELTYFWKKYIADHVTVNRSSSLHDRLLYGLGRYPAMLGYALGYHLVMNQRGSRTWSIQDSFTIKAEEMAAPF